YTLAVFSIPHLFVDICDAVHKIGLLYKRASIKTAPYLIVTDPLITVVILPICQSRKKHFQVGIISQFAEKLD
ncbi:MAG: hypothetical protein C0402_16670, partial [Thermodesulfovibrio sp.]|nr:hypothetical protein [Thermodesulfovibrio sp.]